MGTRSCWSQTWIQISVDHLQPRDLGKPPHLLEPQFPSLFNGASLPADGRREFTEAPSWALGPPLPQESHRPGRPGLGCGAGLGRIRAGFREEGLLDETGGVLLRITTVTVRADTSGGRAQFQALF